MIKKRNPFSALVLSVIPGLGQIYNGQPGKGLIFLGIDLLIPVIFGLTGIVNSLIGLLALAACSVLFIIYRMADGFINAKKLINYELKSYNRWYVYLSYAFAISIVRVFLDLPASTGVQTFKIPTPSMYPTLQPGDRVVASVNFYNQNPIEQGDIVLFNPPQQGGLWIFRVIGLPNDSIEIKSGIVYVNGVACELTATNEFTLDGQEVIQYEEKVNASKTITTLRFKGGSMGDTSEFEKIMIPEDEYFLLGDNRDNAYDSRFLGTIKREQIQGRLVYSFWGETTKRINIDFTQK